MFNNKGNITDIVTGGQILLMIVIVLFIMYATVHNFGTAIKSNTATNSSSVIINNFDSFESKYYKAWDYGFLVVLLMLPILSYFLALKIPSSPIFLIFSLLIVGFLVILMMIFSNIYGKFMDIALFQQFVTNLKIIPLFMPYLPYYGILYAVIVMIGLYQKEGNE